MKHMTITDGGYELHVYKWDKVKDPVGVVQIVQGINENGERYGEFAHYLNSQGYVVYTHDAIGQGLTRNLDDPTVVFEENGFKDLVSGVYAMRRRITVEYPNLKISIIGHSLGASIVRYILIEDLVKYEKVIFSGSGYSKQSLGMGIFIAQAMSLFGRKRPSKFFDKQFRKIQLRLSEKVEINHFIECLSRDEERNEFDKLDKFLYIPLSISAYVVVLKLLSFVNKEKNIKHTNPTSRILMLSGTHDPTTDFGVDTKRLYDILFRMGLDVEIKLYPEARHDLFNEINRLEIYNDVLSFLKQ